MSVNRRLSGSNGRLAPNIKPKHVSNSPRTCWSMKPLLLWVFGVVVLVSVWFIFGNHLTQETACEKSSLTLLQRYNVTRKQLHALASLFTESDQVTAVCLITY